MAIGTSKVGALGGLVPGGSATFNASGTFCVPPGVKKVSITGVGGTGNPGTSGNSGNAGNFGVGGGGGGGGAGSYLRPNPAANFSGNDGRNGGVSFNAGCVVPTPLSVPGSPRVAGNRGTAGTKASPATNPGVGNSGNAGGSGNAGTAGSGGTTGCPGNSGCPSSGLGQTFPGGAGGNAGAAGNAGVAGNGGGGGGGGTASINASSGGAGGTGGGSGAAGNQINNVPYTAVFGFLGGGGGGAGTTNPGNPGRSFTTYGPAPAGQWPGSTPTNNPSLVTANNFTGGRGGTYPGASWPTNDANANNNQPYTYPFRLPYNTFGGNETDCGAPVRVSTNVPNCPTFPLVGVSVNNQLYRSGGGGGTGGTAYGGCTPALANRSPNCPAVNLWKARGGGGGGGGGRGNAGNAGGCGGAGGCGVVATPATFNCVPVTPGSSYPITVASPGGQVVISWNPQ